MWQQRTCFDRFRVEVGNEVDLGLRLIDVPNVGGGVLEAPEDGFFALKRIWSEVI